MQVTTKFHWQAVHDFDIAFYNPAGYILMSVVPHQNFSLQCFGTVGWEGHLACK